MAGDPPREIKSLIDNHIDGFNTQNIELFLGVFGDTAIIIDGIAPYRWLNPNAPANWRGASRMSANATKRKLLPPRVRRLWGTKRTSAASRRYRRMTPQLDQ